MIGSANPLARRYGAIAARRLRQVRPELMSLVSSSHDPDLRDFSGTP
jgi:hypothetical protein